MFKLYLANGKDYTVLNPWPSVTEEDVFLRQCFHCKNNMTPLRVIVAKGPLAGSIVAIDPGAIVMAKYVPYE